MKNASVGPENKVALQILFAIMKNNFENEIVNRREKLNIALSSTEKRTQEILTIVDNLLINLA